MSSPVNEVVSGSLNASPLTSPFEQEFGLYSDPDLWLYRERTTALLRRYLRISIEVGRLPSLLGRELFR